MRRHAGAWSLSALGVAAVISGEFSGWNLGLDAGGFGGLLVAAIIITVMYVGLCYSIAEMAAALPHTGGAYSFARSSMGPWGGFITGVAESIEYIVTPAVIVTFIGPYMQSIVDDLFGVQIAQPIWWLIFYAIFLLLNLVGIELGDAVHGGHLCACPGDPGRLLRRRADKVRLHRQCTQHRARTG